MQIVYISNRPAVLIQTLEYVKHLMPFVDRVLVISPDSQRQLLRVDVGLPMEVVAEEDALGPRRAQFAEIRDHQARNWLLRSRLCALPQVADEFLMADDDQRPLGRVAADFFVRSGRHNSYYHHRLERWPARATDYDRGQHATYRVLEAAGCPTLSYSAHMPQVLYKSLLAETVRRFAGTLSEGLALDEWSLYFNHARSRHPQRFNEPQVFKTLCWPALPTDWDYEVTPDEFRFENFSPILYGGGRFFTGIPRGFDAQRWRSHAEEKIARRCEVQRAYERLRRSWLGGMAIAGYKWLRRIPWAGRLLGSLLLAPASRAVTRRILRRRTAGA